MRQIEDPQLQFGQTNIATIRFDPKSRDDIPQLLQGLQYLYVTPTLRAAVFSLLEEMIPSTVDPTTGRPGMDLWKILVLGVLRLNLNWDYDRLHEMVNQHKTIRQMLGHGLADDEAPYHLQTLKDNVSLLTPALLDRINQVVVNAGHQLVKKNGAVELSGRCDSFVVETDVHYPTDITLLYDALRKIIQLSARLSQRGGLLGWGKSAYNRGQVKRLLRRIQKLKRSTSPQVDKQRQRDQQIRSAHQQYLTLAGTLVARAEKTLVQSLAQPGPVPPEVQAIERFLVHARRQIDQIQRRVIEGETIPHEEKVFSLFEEHTEWISKGKAGVPVELGLNVCVLEDQYGFLLHHQVMQGQTDAVVAVPMVEQAQTRFPALTRCSFDGGFYSPDNQTALHALLEDVVLPKKGRRTPQEHAVEAAASFIHYRRQHAAVESAINALEVHGLDRCPDQGIDGFKRYVALALVARNIQQLGALLQKKQAKAYKRRRQKAA